jgi:hypothetical protein
MKERERLGLGSGGARGSATYFAGLASAWASCEARLELRNSAWLRDVFRMSSAVPSWPEPS